MDDAAILNAVARIVAAIVATHGTDIADLPTLVSQVRQALGTTASQPEPEIAKPQELVPTAKKRGRPRREPAPDAAPAETATHAATVFPNHIVCLDCGKHVMQMKMHLRNTHNTTWDAYRKKHGLPATYPAIPPAMAQRFRERAAEQGLGKGLMTRWPQRREAARKAMEQQETVSPLPPTREPYNPAVDPRASVFPNYLICLSCGRQFGTLTKHIRVRHKLTWDGYKARWNLPNSYPSVSPKVLEQQRAKALRIGLGRGIHRGGRKPAESTLKP